MIVICDIDGTICDLSHRLHFIENPPKSWDAFHAACSDDLPIHAMRDILCRLIGDDAVFYVTGRNEAIRRQTVDWLDKHGFPQGALFMRNGSDRRQDWEVKREILHEQIYPHNPKSEILCVLEDRDQVVKMWREEGLVCLQVKDGAY